MPAPFWEFIKKADSLHGLKKLFCSLELLVFRGTLHCLSAHIIGDKLE